jgi:hypothetical protein
MLLCRLSAGLSRCKILLCINPFIVHLIMLSLHKESNVNDNYNFAVEQLVEALRYKLEGRGFDSR